MPLLTVRQEAPTEDGGKRPAPEALVMRGSVIPVVLTLTEETKRAFEERKLQVPEPVSGLAMIDTGASSTCFDETSARKAGLVITQTAMMSSASHEKHEVPVFLGRILGNPGPINVDAHLGLGANLTHFGLVALIGRDMLHDALFTYNGADGSFSIAR